MDFTFENYNTKQAWVQKKVNVPLDSTTILWVCLFSTLRVQNAAGDGFNDSLNPQIELAKAREQLGRIERQRLMLIHNTRAWNRILKLGFNDYITQELQDDMEVKVQGSWDEVLQCHTLRADANMMLIIHPYVDGSARQSQSASELQLADQAVPKFPFSTGTETVNTSGTGSGPNKATPATTTPIELQLPKPEPPVGLPLPRAPDTKQKKGRSAKSSRNVQDIFQEPRRSNSCY